MSYRIKLDVFEGPFDLLLHLIKINEMDIYDIEIRKITEQYLDYINLIKTLDLEVAGEFLVMAATLLKLKSSHLLPPSEEENEEEEIDEILSTKQLICQLVEYRKFKGLAEDMKERAQEYSRVHYRTKIIPILPEPEKIEQPQHEIRLLYDALARVIRFMEEQGFHEVTGEEYTVEEKIAYLQDLFKTEEFLNVIEVLKRCFSKKEIITTFLALLEMCRLRQITIVQLKSFGEIIAKMYEKEVNHVG